MTKEHPTGSFLDLANRLEIRDAWFHIIDRGGLQSAGSHPCSDAGVLRPLYHKLRLQENGSTSRNKCRIYNCSILGHTGNRDGYPIEISIVLIDHHSHAVNINYFTPEQGHVSIQTNVFALETQINEELQKVVLTRIGNMYGI